jgi:phage shock protein E
MNFKKSLKVAMAILIFVCPILAKAETVWIDVRSEAEHKINNIQSNILIPHLQIVSDVSKLFPDQETEIRLYCRSGVRAEIAKSALIKAGYKNVFNEGSIEDARKIQKN